MSAGVPDFLDRAPKRFRGYWREPWRRRARASSGFRRLIWKHGYLSPNFARAEAGSKGGDSCGCPAVAVPESARRRSQRHAFRLEIARHKLGDKPMTPLSWGRSECHNRCVGGASASQHLQWRATDWSDAERARLGSSRFDDVMFAVFKRGGIGVVGNTRHVRHVDTRGWPARWSY